MDGSPLFFCAASAVAAGKDYTAGSLNCDARTGWTPGSKAVRGPVGLWTCVSGRASARVIQQAQAESNPDRSRMQSGLHSSGG